MTSRDTPGGRLKGVPSHERHFYGLTRAIGRFGMRIFTPFIMEQPHWHGHIEANFLTGAEMAYDIDGQPAHIPEGRLVLFWAGIPHQLTRLTPAIDPSAAAQAPATAGVRLRQNTMGLTNPDPPPIRLANIYLPIDTFLFMPHIAQLQVALLGGALVCLPGHLCDADQIGRWYRDYRSNDFERMEVMKMELNAVLRRALTEELQYLRPPLAEMDDGRSLSSAHIRHVVEMVRFILENLSRPISNADVAAVTGLHQNYALSLFTRTMQLPMKKFVIRIRLLRARALLMESSLAIAKVAEDSGFASISQFYAHFKASYGMPPHAMRAHYTQMALR